MLCSFSSEGMGPELGEALKRLCVEIGWSYAVFWSAVGLPSPKHLVWGDGHWYGKLQRSVSDGAISYINSLTETCIDELVNKTMIPLVHVVGAGIVGQAASTGDHRWILGNVAGENGSTLRNFPDINYQFLAGIQTIVIIPVFSHGVVQIGSTKKVMENLLFVDQAKTSFMQLFREPGSIYGLTRNSFNQNILPFPSINPEISNLFSDNCSNVDKSLSLRCDHQLSISSAGRSMNLSSSSSSICENLLKINAELLSNTKNVGLTSPHFTLLNCHPSGNTLSHLNKQLENELMEDLMLFNRVPVTSGCLSAIEENLLSSCGSLFADIDFDSLLPKFEPIDSTSVAKRLTSDSACSSEIVHTRSNVSCAVHQGLINFNGNQATLVNSHANSLSRKPGSCGASSIDLQKHIFGRPTAFGASQGIKTANFRGNDSCKGETLQKNCSENDSSFLFMPGEKFSSFSRSGTSRGDLFEMLDRYTNLNRGLDCEQQLVTDVPAHTTRSNISTTNYSMDDDASCAEVFSESKNSGELLDAVVSNIYHHAKQCSDKAPSMKASIMKPSGSSTHCVSSCNDGSTSSGQKLGEYISGSMASSNGEATDSTSVRTADSIIDTERPRYDKPQSSLWVEKGNTMNGSGDIFGSHAKRVHETSKVNRKRARPGEIPRPRPKDRQLIMDRVKELREIVPDGAKCSIDSLLEKTIRHMLFLQSVTKHADMLKDSEEPKIISKDGVVALKENLRGGSTWAFEVGSQAMACPIIVEDLNPPREMLVEMLCEERGLFLEIADLIRGLGLTILKGVMEARREKIWARFAVEANRDVTRMEIFLSLVQLLESTIGSAATPHSLHHNTKIPQNIFSHPCILATGMSDAL